MSSSGTGRPRRSAASVSYDSRTSHVVTARGEVELGTRRQEAAARGWSQSLTIGAEGTLIDGSAPGASLAGQALNLPGFISNEARGFVGMDFRLKRDGVEVMAKGEVGYNTAGVFSSGLQVGIGLRF